MDRIDWEAQSYRYLEAARNGCRMMPAVWMAEKNSSQRADSLAAAIIICFLPIEIRC